MTVVAYKPFVHRVPVRRFHTSSGPSAMRPVFTPPPVNIAEREDEFVIELAVPGFEKTEFELRLDKEVLVIAGKRKGAEEQTNGYTRREFHTPDFERRFTLSDKVAKSRISAAYENGVLRVRLPKAEEVKPRKVEVA